MTKLNELSATEAASRIAQGAFSSESLVKACLDRIAAREPGIQAWVHLDPEQALLQARQADKRRADGQTPGPLHGVPVGIKDIIDTADMPTQHGSPLFAGRRPQDDAAVVASLRAAGAIIMGKTVTTELANLHPNKTRNPHNPAHTPGGSSSGSGAAVADFHVPLALATQTGGSVIRPASFNGIYALKPTLGLVPRTGVLMQSHTLDTVGVYARSIEDLGLITDVIADFDPADSHSFQEGRAAIPCAFNQPLKRNPRFAFLRTPAWDQADNVARKAIETVVRDLGEQCAEVSLPEPWDQVTDLHARVMAAEGSAYYGEYVETQPDLVSDVLTAHLARGRSVRADDYIKALKARETIYRDLEKLLDNYDAVICLSAPGAAPYGLEATGNPIFNGLWTYLGVPCVSLPHLSAAGLPLGIQLVGKRREDAALLQISKWLDDRMTSSE